MKKIKHLDDILLLLIIGYIVFIEPKVPESIMKRVLMVVLIILLFVMIVDKSINIYSIISKRNRGS